MVVDQRFCDAGVLRDARRAGGIETVFGKQLDGRIYQCLFTIHGLFPQIEFYWNWV